MDKFTYTGSKIKNQFTAYILAQIRGARQNYLRKMLRISRNEMPAEDLTMEEMSISVEESLEKEYHEELLMREAKGIYPKWDEIDDQKLVEALLLLRNDERKLIYQHVFEELTFDDMSRINGLPDYKVKGIYYYVIRKIRKFEEVLYRAQTGDKEAVLQILEMFRPLLIKNSLVNGRFDEDLYQELRLEVLKCIRGFRELD